MRRVLISVASVLAMTFAVSAAAAPASAQTTGPEALTTVVVATGALGERQVASSTVIAQGVFNGVGRVAEQENSGDPPSASREAFVFPAGALYLHSITENSSFSVFSLTCVFTAVTVRRGTFDGGTGQFAQSSGTYVETVRDWGTLSRDLDGSCSRDRPPLHDVLTTRVTGTLSY
jgi:hypothetical protein